nr:RHS domain-containing protein [Serratia entomophila]
MNSAPLEVTDAAGNLRWSGQYDSFGKLQGQRVVGAARRNGAQYDQPPRLRQKISGNFVGTDTCPACAIYTARRRHSMPGLANITRLPSRIRHRPITALRCHW